MLSQEDLVYVDKQYKNDMEEYESIKKMTHRVVVENGPSGQLIGNWKKGIRETLIDVRTQFNEWINAFTIRFVDKLNKIEQSREMLQYADQDRFITSQVRELENKYTRILNIFTDIQHSQPDKKLEMIQGYKKEMKSIEQQVSVLDK